MVDGQLRVFSTALVHKCIHAAPRSPVKVGLARAGLVMLIVGARCRGYRSLALLSRLAISCVAIPALRRAWTFIDPLTRGNDPPRLARHSQICLVVVALMDLDDFLACLRWV